MIRQSFRLLCLVLAIQLALGIGKYKVYHPHLDVESFFQAAEVQTQECYWRNVSYSECYPTTQLICNQEPCIETNLETGTCIAEGVQIVSQVNTHSGSECSCMGCDGENIIEQPCLADLPCTCMFLGFAVPCSQIETPTPQEPPTPCPLGQWSDWGGCYVGPDPCKCDRSTGVAQTGLSWRKRVQVPDGTCLEDGSYQSESKTAVANCPPQHCVQTAFTDKAPCPTCWNRTASPFASPTVVQSSIVSAWPLFGGRACEGTCTRTTPTGNTGTCQKVRPCQIPACPRNCEVGPWTQWCDCDKTCYDTENPCDSCVGRHSRTRVVTVQAADGGAGCPYLYEVENCNENPCPVDCLETTWEPWTPCNAECGGGQRTRRRTVLKYAKYNGRECGALFETEVCGTDECPVSCQVGPWTDFEPLNCPACLPEGQSVVRRKTREVTVPQDGGAECPPTEYTEPCASPYCPIDCVVTDWTDWSPCSASCGGGTQERRRVVQNYARYGGHCDYELFESKPCGTDDCAIDCVYTWGPWQDKDTGKFCSKACGGGVQHRTLQILVHPNALGRPCPPSPEEQPCNTHCCRVDCEVGPYDLTEEQCKNEACPSDGCGLRICTRSREVTRAATCGGSTCPVLYDYVWCKKEECTAPCIWGEWSSWEPPCPPCSDVGTPQVRKKFLLQGDHEHCGATQEEHRTCSAYPCPIDCVVSDWTGGGELDACSVTCGVGYKHKQRHVITADQWNGAPCPYLDEYVTCIKDPCKLPCLLSDWSAWGPCDQTCTPVVDGVAQVGHQTRTRVVLIEGEECASEPLSETRECNDRCCPVHCQVGEWGAFPTCGLIGGVQHCGLNTIKRTRAVTVLPDCEGRPCPDLEEDQFCDAGPCPHPCEFTPWSTWGPWSATCGPAHRVRKRILLNSSQGDTRICPPVIDTQTKPDPQPCPVDCQFHYGPWGPCNEQGYRRRPVLIDVLAAGGGKKCPDCKIERDDCTPPVLEHECWLEECD